MCYRFYKLEDMQRNELRLKQEKLTLIPILKELHTTNDKMFIERMNIPKVSTKERTRPKPTLEELHTIKNKVFQKIFLNLAETLNKGDNLKEKKIWYHLFNSFH